MVNEKVSPSHGKESLWDGTDMDTENTIFREYRLPQALCSGHGAECFMVIMCHYP